MMPQMQLGANHQVLSTVVAPSLGAPLGYLLFARECIQVHPMDVALKPLAD
jgi:hypothetical protein